MDKELSKYTDDVEKAKRDYFQSLPRGEPKKSLMEISEHMLAVNSNRSLKEYMKGEGGKSQKKMKKSATSVNEIEYLADDLEKKGYKTSLKSYFQSKTMKDPRKYSPQKDDELSNFLNMFTQSSSQAIQVNETKEDFIGMIKGKDEKEQNLIEPEPEPEPVSLGGSVPREGSQ